MRLMAPIIAALLLAACQPETESAPAPETAEATPEQTGEDDPAIPFTPAPVAAPAKYEAYSKTAMSFTPGILTLTPTPQKSENLPPGAVFTFGNGYILDTTSIPGGATQGATPFDFKPFFITRDGAALDPANIQVYAVDDEIVPPGSANGGFCDKTSFVATHTAIGAGTEDLMIIAFSGDQWPPAVETAVCGTFSYARVP